MNLPGEKEIGANVDEEASTHNVAKGWKYRSWKLGPWTIPYYASPEIQIIVVAFVCFLCPGMFNAVNGLGGGGLLNHKVSTDANVAVYSTFAVVGFFAGSVTNRLGVKIALSLGGIGYSVYVSSYLVYKHTENYGYSIFAGALLGCCAGLLWSGQGAIMLAYGNENQKGRFIGWFWLIFNLGAVIGGLIPLGQNLHATTKKSVNDGTYIAFLVLTVCGAILALFLVNAKNVIRSDGSKIILQKRPSWRTELLGLYYSLKADPYVMFLFPMFFSSNFFYTYHFNVINGSVFDTRTAALNSVLYYLMQIFAALIFGYALDLDRFRRSTRAKAVWLVMLTLTMGIWGGGFAFQSWHDYNRAAVVAASKTPPGPGAFPVMDWRDSRYIGPMFLYMAYGFYDAAWQTMVYWLIGSLSNNSRTLANFAGFYKGIQSAGSAISWRLDGIGVSYWAIFATNWGLLGGSLLCALPVVLFKVHDTTSLERDLAFSDETRAEVEAKAGGVEERLQAEAELSHAQAAEKS